MENKVTNIEEFCPKSSSFKMHSNGKEYEVMPLSSLVESQFEAKFGGSVSDVLKQKNADPVYWLLYMLIRDKADFKAKEEELMDEQGIVHKRMIGGVDRLKLMCSGGAAEQGSILNAITVAQYGKTFQEIMAFAEQKKLEKEDPEKKPLTS